MLFARPVIDLYLGRRWAGVAEVVIALAPMMAIRLVSVAIGSTALVLRRPQWSLVANAGLLAILVGSWLAARLWRLGFMDFLWLTSLASVAIYAGYILFMVRAVAGRHCNHRAGDTTVANRSASASQDADG